MVTAELFKHALKSLSRLSIYYYLISFPESTMPLDAAESHRYGQ